MVGDRRRTRDLVDAHRADHARTGRTLTDPRRRDHDHRDGSRQAHDRTGRVDLRRDHDDPLDTLTEEVVHDLPHRRRVEPRHRRDRHVVPSLARRDLDADRRRRRAVQRRSGRDDTEDPRPVRRERTRRAVAAVAQLVDRVEDPRTRLRPHVRVVVEHPRDGLVGDAGTLGDVRHRGRSRRAGTHTHLAERHVVLPCRSGAAGPRVRQLSHRASLTAGTRGRSPRCRPQALRRGRPRSR